MTTFAVRGHATLRRSAALSCHTYGWGTPLLLIHGIGTTGALFAPIVPILSSHYHLIVPDLRGHGRSSGLGCPTPVAQLAADLPNLFDLLGVRRCHVVGFGHGGLVAQQLAASAPERIHRLVLVGTPASPDTSARNRIASALLPSAMRVLGSKVFGKLALGSNACSTDRGAAAAARLLLGFDSRPLHSQISCPTLVIQGGQDTLVPPHHGETLATRLPEGTLHTIPNAGHRMLATHTDAVVKQLTEWLT